MKWLMFLVASVFAQNMTVRPPSQCITTPRSLSGSWTGTTAGSIVGFGGTCNGVSYNSATGENIVIVSLPQNAPVGGTLSLDTCTGTTWDTELIVSTPLPAGIRCPSNSSMFTCLAASDDASACGNGMQSRVSIPASPGSTYAVIVTGFGTSSGPYTLNWNYAVGPTYASTASNNVSPSNSVTSRPSPSFTPSMTVTPSPSLASQSSSFTIRPSVSSTPTMAASYSASETHTRSSTPSASSTKSASFSMTDYPTRTPIVLAGPPPSNTDSDSIMFGRITIGVVITAFVALGVFGAWVSYNNRNNQRRSVHLSPNIYFNASPDIEQVAVETRNTSFRIPQSAKRVHFDPVQIGASKH